MLDLEEGVRELFLDAQQMVFDTVRARYAIVLNRKLTWAKENPDALRQSKASYRARNRAALAAKERERYWQRKCVG